jgi:chemotaxis protein MotB
VGRKVIIRKEGIPQGVWMNTFSDMTTLLLTFFVLLFSMSSITSEKFQEFFRSFTGDELGLLQAGDLVSSSGFIYDPIPEVPKSPARMALVDLANSTDTSEGTGSVADAVEFYVDDAPEGAISIVLADKILFEEGSATLTPEAQTFLLRLREFLARVLALSDRRVVVEGYTDDILPPREGYILSARQAVAVLDVLLAQREGDATVLPPERFMVVGYGAMRPKVPNDSPENRAVNRRVRILLQPPDASIFDTQNQ